MDKIIDQMDLKEIKTEVQRLRDELARMKRSYDDILYNLDSENFSDNYAPVKAQYSANGTSWHNTFTSGDLYIHLSFDSGASWSGKLKFET